MCNIVIQSNATRPSTEIRVTTSSVVWINTRAAFFLFFVCVNLKVFYVQVGDRAGQITAQMNIADLKTLLDVDETRVFDR